MCETTVNTGNFDEQESPAWLDTEFFTNVLCHCEKSNDVKIKTLGLTPATAKNDHYASIMFRATIVYFLRDELKSMSMVLKMIPEVESRKKNVLEKSYVFETEIGIYTEVIPRFEAILRTAGDKTKFGPTCIYHSLKPKKVIIFEDLTTYGYQPYREQTLRSEIVSAAYEKLAKWHAVGYKLVLESPHEFDAFRYGIMNSSFFSKPSELRNGIFYFIEMLDSHEDLMQYKPHFETLSMDEVFGGCIETFEEFRRAPQMDTYYALCHGDFHCKNFMLKHKNKTAHIDDLMLLDYQLSYVGPIVNDIIYSIYMLLDDEHRTDNLHEILHSYFTQFEKTLKEIGYCGPLPKIVEFHKQMLKTKFFTLFLLTSLMPAWYAMKEADFNYESFTNLAERHRNLYTNPKYLKDVRKLLPKLLHQGYLENVYS